MFAIASQASAELSSRSAVALITRQHEVSEDSPLGIGEVPSDSECAAECSGLPEKDNAQCYTTSACVCDDLFLNGYHQCKQCLIGYTPESEAELKESMRLQTNAVIDEILEMCEADGYSELNRPHIPEQDYDGAALNFQRPWALGMAVGAVTTFVITL